MANHKLAAKFSKDENPRNGFGDAKFVADVVRERGAEGYAVVRYETVRITDEIIDGGEVPTFRIHAAEPLEGEAAEAAKRLMDQRYMERGNRQDLPQEGMFGVNMQIEGEDGDEVDGDGERVVPPPSLEERRAEKAEAAAKASGGDA